MRPVTAYLISYFGLVIGAVLALGYGGALQQAGTAWVIGGLAIAAGLGLVARSLACACRS